MNTIKFTITLILFPIAVSFSCLCFVSLEFSFLSENNYLVRQYICAHTMLIKTPLLHQSFGPRVLLSLSLSLSGYFFGVQRHSEFTFLHGLLRPSQEGAVCLHPI